MAMVAPDLPQSVYHDEALAEIAWENGWQAYILERERSEAAAQAEHPAPAPATPSQVAAPWRKNLRNQVYLEHYLIGGLVGAAFAMAGSVIGLI